MTPLPMGFDEVTEMRDQLTLRFHGGNKKVRKSLIVFGVALFVLLVALDCLILFLYPINFGENLPMSLTRAGLMLLFTASPLCMLAAGVLGMRWVTVICDRAKGEIVVTSKTIVGTKNASCEISKLLRIELRKVEAMGEFGGPYIYIRLIVDGPMGRLTLGRGLAPYEENIKALTALATNLSQFLKVPLEVHTPPGWPGRIPMEFYYGLK